jgi:uncharacterized membrane protein YciS (DUF1049 family)
MIRYIFIGAMSALLCIVLYIPSRVGPAEFMQVLRDEHALASEVWGQETADRILARMLDLQQASAMATPASAAAPAAELASAPGGAVDAAMAAQVGQVGTRLFSNPYFQSIDSLFALVSYRLCAALELLPVLAAFLFAVVLDGSVVRIVRSKELIAHSAERFSASLAAGILLGAGVVVAWFLPIQLHPMVVMAALLAMLFVTSRALANYHVLR